MSVLIRDMEMPTEGEWILVNIFPDGKCVVQSWCGKDFICAEKLTAVPVPEHGRLIDADALRAKMYHEAFETDSPMQKWDSGCWIRYKMFERLEENAPTIIPADKEGE